MEDVFLLFLFSLPFFYGQHAGRQEVLDGCWWRGVPIFGRFSFISSAFLWKKWTPLVNQILHFLNVQPFLFSLDLVFFVLKKWKTCQNVIIILLHRSFFLSFKPPRNETFLAISVVHRTFYHTPISAATKNYLHWTDLFQFKYPECSLKMSATGILKFK